MPIYRISDATTGKPLRLVAADNKAVALRHRRRPRSRPPASCDWWAGKKAGEHERA